MKHTLSTEELLSCLVGFDSTSRNSNLPIADFICNYLDVPGVRIERHQSTRDRKVNLIISVGPDCDGSRDGLVLSGHMDTVPADEPGWRSDPFTLTRVADTLVGRGSCDMKGFLAVAMNTLVAAHSSDLKRPLVLVFTYDEEVGTVGAQYFAETWPDATTLPANTIVGEPTSLRAIRMHKGHLEFSVAVSGKSAHSGYPHLGENAIEPVGRLITALTDLRRELESEPQPYAEYFPEVPFVALNVARVSGGSAINVVPDSCVLQCGIRLLPGMTKEITMDRLKQVVAESLDGTYFELDLMGEAPPMLLAESAPIYQALCTEIGQDETLSASYATDAGWFQSLGMRCAIFGPGSIEVAHKPNESIPLQQLNQASEILERIVHSFCIAD
ncbi:MAG: acetylornithine deacetylase [Gemmatimonadota bacterium]|nr:MAG: acetylornithine deacetylase [Gemmatimonadota bacterium]